MKKRYAMGLVLAAVMLVAATYRVDWSVVCAAWREASWTMLLAALAIKWITFDLKASRWFVAVNLFAKRLSPPNTSVSRRSVLAASLIGFAGNIFLPARLGDVARVTYLSQKHHLPLTAMVSSASIGPLMDLLAMALSVLALVGTAVGTLVNPLWASITVMGLISLFGGLAWFAQITPVSARSHTNFMWQIIDQVHLRLRGLKSGWSSLRDPRSMLVMMTHTLAILIAEFVAMALALHAFGLPSGWPVPLALLVALTLSFAFNLTPGNIGPHQWISVIVLGLYDVPDSHAVAFSVAFQGSVHIMVVLSALIVLLRTGKTRSSQATPPPLDSSTSELESVSP
jgi:uncharacterized protein (TIRG00374 family)